MDSEKKLQLLFRAIKDDMSKATFMLQKPDEPFYKLDNDKIELLLAIAPTTEVRIHHEFLVLIKFTKTTTPNETNESEVDEATILNKELPQTIEKEQFAFYKVRFVSNEILDIFKNNGMSPTSIELYDIYETWNDAFFFIKREYEFYVDGYDAKYELLKDELNFIDFMASDEAKTKDVKSIPEVKQTHNR